MKAVRCADGNICKEQSKILAEQAKFYKDLYSCDSNITFTLTPSNEERILSNLERVGLEHHVTLQESP